MSMKRPANRTGAGGKPHVADCKRNGSECCLTEADVVQWIASHGRQWKGHLRKLSYNVLVQWAHVLEVSIYKDKGKLPKDQLCEYVSKKAAEVAKVQEKRSHPPLLDSTQQPPAKKGLHQHCIPCDFRRCALCSPACITRSQRSDSRR